MEYLEEVQLWNFLSDTNLKKCDILNKIKKPMKSTRGTSPVTVRQPANGKVPKLDRWEIGNTPDPSDDGSFSCILFMEKMS